MQDPRHDPVSRTGLEGKEISSPSGRRRKMPLTSPLIDQALSQLCAFCSSFCRSMSEAIIVNYRRKCEFLI
jgi:hypothetical protein